MVRSLLYTLPGGLPRMRLQMASRAILMFRKQGLAPVPLPDQLHCSLNIHVVGVWKGGCVVWFLAPTAQS
jgi:hypothetical protein